MLNHGRLTNEELINLLAATRLGLEDADEHQIKNWNEIHNKSAELVLKRLERTESDEV